jgi:dihydrofolate reductase
MAGRTQYFVASSIDGFIAANDDGLDWLLQFDFAEFQARYDEFFAGVGAIVMGARTYEFLLAGGADAWTYADTPCWVLTHREYSTPGGANVTFLAGDAHAAHAAPLRAAGDRNVWVLGGGDVAAQLVAADLVDELILTIVPILLGSGKQLVPGISNTHSHRLLDLHRYESGAVELRYELDVPAARAGA